MSGSGLSFFLSADTLKKAPSWPIDDFCTLVFSEMENIRDPNTIRVDEIRHYKEKDGLEHEFLLVGVKHGEKHYLLRIERSISARVQRTFWQKLKQTSASIIPALDTVSISSSLKKLTTDMNRGPIIHIATLPISSGIVTLRDFCLLLSLFPSFSPTYKLKEEQCYWFCNVVLATISSISHTTPIPKEGFKRAGKYSGFSINVSAKTHQLFVGGYQIIRRLQDESNDALENIDLTSDTAQALVAMLTVQSDEAKTRALKSIISWASYSLRYRQLLVDAGVAEHLRLIFISSSNKALIFLAANALNLPLFNPLPDAKLIETPPNSAKGDTFAQEDRKNMELKYINALRDLIALLEDARPIVCSRSQMALTDFSRDEKYRPFVLQVIPHMIQCNSSKVCLIGLNIMTDIAQYPDTREPLRKVILQVFPISIRDTHKDVRVASIASLRRLADTVELCQQSITIFPLLTFLFLNNNDDGMAFKVEELYSSADGFIGSVEAAITNELSGFGLDNLCLVGLKAISAAARHSICHPIIKDIFPQIIGLLAHESWEGRQAAVDLLCEFIPIFEFRHRIEEAIPNVFDLLRDDNRGVRHSAVNFMTKSASDCKFCSTVFELFPQIVGLLTGESWQGRSSAVDLLSILTPDAEFRPHVEKAILRVTELLRDSDWDVQKAAIKFLKQTIFYFNNNPAIVGAIPQIVHLLTHWFWDISNKAADLLCDLMTHPNLRPHIQSVIPEAKKFQSSEDEVVRESAGKVLKKASEYGIF